MKIKTNITTLFTSAVLMICSSSVFAGEVDILVDKLVEKNILSKSEAGEIVKEIKEESKKSPAHWAEKVKLKGDVRVRYQTEDKENDGKVSRDRGRVRARLGIIAKPVDKWETGIGIATGGDDPRSTNATLDSTFDSIDMRIDYAYAKYSPSKAVSLMGGKIKNPIWGTKDLLWDSDINPEGIAVELIFKANDNLKIFVTPLYYILDEFSSSKDDPAMMALQAGVDWKINDTVSLKFAPAFYNFTDVQGNDLSEHGAGTNNVDGSGNLMYDYDALTADAELGFKLSKKMKVFEYIKIFGQYVDSDADSNNTGYLYGFKFGDKNLSGLDSWEFKVNYRKLEADAWLDFLPDSDFYGGATDVKGIEYELKLGLTKKVSLGFDFYNSKPINVNVDRKQKLFQADLVVKF